MNIIYFKKLESTHAYAKQNIDLFKDKTIISTNIQTDGYGRFTRKWIDLGKENIYMTFVLKPSDKLLDVYANLTQYLSVCLCKQLEELGLYPKIKWPNDVLLNDKKASGILAEIVMKKEQLKGIVLSIGINLNISEKDLKKIDRPVTGINLELKKPMNKQEFMQKLIENFFANYDEFLEKGFKFIKSDYEKRASFLNQNIKIIVFKSIKEGLFKGFDDHGNLVLYLSDDKIEKINMGEVVSNKKLTS